MLKYKGPFLTGLLLLIFCRKAANSRNRVFRLFCVLAGCFAGVSRVQVSSLRCGDSVHLQFCAFGKIVYTFLNQ
ncbi:hypothetical protein TMES_05460 [Thalassospira mesophila]|uniref:Uncharacterized protein n=1 Tax=Thalassospira mesophila TaxID=1293891 RepID=A0A1Y2L1X8_9PROT|nr:hypothetical protein TMES_05460 [Thalassospira mesophila]